MTRVAGARAAAISVAAPAVCCSAKSAKALPANTKNAIQCKRAMRSSIGYRTITTTFASQWRTSWTLTFSTKGRRCPTVVVTGPTGTKGKMRTTDIVYWHAKWVTDMKLKVKVKSVNASLTLRPAI